MRPQFSQYNVDLAVDGSQPLGVSIRTIHSSMSSSYHEIARVTSGGQAARQGVEVGDVLIGINHIPVPPMLTHTEVVSRIVVASRAWHHMKLNVVRNLNRGRVESQGHRGSTSAGAPPRNRAHDTADMRCVPVLFKGCGPEPLDPTFVTTWEHVVAIQGLASTQDWLDGLCCRAGVSGPVRAAAGRLQRATAGHAGLIQAFTTLTDRRHRRHRSSSLSHDHPHQHQDYQPLLPYSHHHGGGKGHPLLERAHWLLCLRVMTKFVCDEADVDEVTMCSLVDELRQVTDRQWASLEFKACGAVDWRLRDFCTSGGEFRDLSSTTIPTTASTTAAAAFKTTAGSISSRTCGRRNSDDSRLPSLVTGILTASAQKQKAPASAPHTECTFWCGGPHSCTGCTCQPCQTNAKAGGRSQSQQLEESQLCTSQQQHQQQQCDTSSGSSSTASSGSSSTPDDGSKPRRWSDAEDSIALLLALDESRLEEDSCSTSTSTSSSPHYSDSDSDSGRSRRRRYPHSDQPNERKHSSASEISLGDVSAVSSPASAPGVEYSTEYCSPPPAEAADGAAPTTLPCSPTSRSMREVGVTSSGGGGRNTRLSHRQERRRQQRPHCKRGQVQRPCRHQNAGQPGEGMSEGVQRVINFVREKFQNVNTSSSTTAIEAPLSPM